LALTVSITSISAQSQSDIPVWVKGVADFWVKGNISDSDFGESISFLIEQDIIHVDMPDTKDSETVNKIMMLEIENRKLKIENKEQEKTLISMLSKYEELKKVVEGILKERDIGVVNPPTPESTYLSGQFVPDSLWGSVDAEYYDDRYERLNLEIYTSDKFQNDFVFKQGRVDVLVWFEAQSGVSVHGGTNNQDYSHLGIKDIMVIEQTVEFSESNYSYYNKLVFNIEGCLPAEDYFVEATIWSDTGKGFTFNNEFTVSDGSC